MFRFRGPDTAGVSTTFCLGVSTFDFVSVVVESLIGVEVDSAFVAPDFFPVDVEDVNDVLDEIETDDDDDKDSDVGLPMTPIASPSCRMSCSRVF